MLKTYFRAPLLALLLAAAPAAFAQTPGVGIGTTAPDASAALDIVSSSKGALLPRVASAAALVSPATGLLVTVSGSPFPAGVTPFSVNVDPSGQFLYVANFGTAVTDSGSISIYRIAIGGGLTTVTSPATTGAGFTSITTSQ